MTATFTGGVLTIQTLAEALEERIVAVAAALSLTAEQTQRLRTRVESVLGNLLRVEAEADVAAQEALYEVFSSLSMDAEHGRLDAVVYSFLGMTREAARTSEVTVTATPGEDDEIVSAGTRFRYDPTGSTWAVVADATVAGGEVSFTLRSESVGAVDEVEIGSTEWTALESVPAIPDATITTTAQPIVGRPVETDPQLRVRAGLEAFRRGQGPYTAIEAQVIDVDGVTFARAYDNPEDVTDANGIPPRNVYVVVEGGTDEDVAAAIWRSRAGGIRTHGTDIVEVITTGPNRSVTIRADRVEEIEIWVRATLTTSTSEIPPPDNLDDLVEAAILAKGESTAAIGADVLPRRFAAALEGIEGFDAVVIELSLDGVAWQTTKISIGASQRPAFAAARISAVPA